jgi:hypothetical protein
LAEWSNGLNYNDYNYVAIDLYQTKKGAFFMRSWSTGKITVLSTEETQIWLDEISKCANTNIDEIADVAIKLFETEEA